MLRQHMDPEQALQAFEDLGARTFVAMHWGTFKLGDEPLDEPPRRVEAERSRRRLAPERVRVLAMGETLEVRSRRRRGRPRALTRRALARVTAPSLDSPGERVAGILT